MENIQRKKMGPQGLNESNYCHNHNNNTRSNQTQHILTHKEKMKI